MKKSVIIALVVLLAGVFAGGKYLESRVVSNIKDMMAQSGDRLTGNVEFSIWDRKLSVADLRYVLPVTDQDSTAVQVKKGEAVLPWSLIVNPSAEGQVLVAESYFSEDMILEQRELKGSIARDTAKNVSADLGLLKKVFSTSDVDPADLAAMYEKFAYEIYNASGVVFEIADECRITIDSSTLENYNGLRIGNLKAEGIKAVLIDDDVEMTIGSMEMVEMDIPPNAFRMMLEVSYEEMQSPMAAETFLKTLLGGKSPLLSRFVLQDVQLNVEDIPVRLASLQFDWTSNTPLKYTSALTGLSIPAGVIEQRSGMLFPGMKNFVLDTRTAIETSDEGVLTEHDVYSIKDVAEIEVRGAVITDGPAVPITMMDAASMMRLNLVEMNVALTDKNLLAYLALNNAPEGASAEELALQAEQSLQGKAKPEQIDAIRAFVIAPGTLRLSLKPEEPLPLMSLLMGMAGDPLSMIEITAEQGTPLDDTLEKLRSLR